MACWDCRSEIPGLCKLVRAWRGPRSWKPFGRRRQRAFLYEVSQNLVNDGLILNTAVRRIGESLPRERGLYALGYSP